MSKKIKIGLFGLGAVGGGLVNIIRRRRRQLLDYADIELEIAKAVVREPNKKRSASIDGIQISTEHDDILRDNDIDIVVELIGGIEPAATIVRSALESGKPVVSANKTLIAERGPQLQAIAAKAAQPFYAEASVGGGIPILKTLRESFAANEISRLTAIINSTTNFILTKMEEEGLSYFESLKMASSAGFAGADPTLDVEGVDAEQKLRILVAHICGGTYPEGEMFYEGITGLTPRDFAFARKNDMAIKLLAVARRTSDEAIELHVYPTLIPKIHSLAGVRNEFNAILLEGDSVGEVMLSGRGAGAMPTANAVYADIVDICTKKVNPKNYAETSKKPLKIIPHAEIQSDYYVRITVLDKPGVIGEITSILGKHKISVSSIAAELTHNVDRCGEVEVITHRAKEKDIHAALNDINSLDRTEGDCRFLRIERGLAESPK